jgi:hypothetical protein
LKNPSSNPSDPPAPGRFRLAIAAAVPIAAVVVTQSCTIQRPVELPSASAESSAPARKPDGVAVDLEGAIPPPVPTASTGAGVAALQEPAAPDAAVAVVRAFFEAVRRGDMPALRHTLSADATFAPIGTTAGQPAEAQWNRRMRKIDYRTLGGSALFLENNIEMYRYADLDDLVGDRPARPALMTAHDVLVRVPIVTTRIGVDRVFGDEIIFVLRRADRTYRIQGVFEDFQVP